MKAVVYTRYGPPDVLRLTDVDRPVPAGKQVLVKIRAVSLNASKNNRTFALRVRGDSMIDAHILDGDVVILEDRKDVQNGDIVAALIDGETTLKRYVLEHGRAYLKAENAAYPNLVPARELRIQGVMISLIRKQPAAARRKR